MLSWEKPIPDFLLKKGNIVRTILFTAAFALAFINIYAPFGVNYWLHVTKITLFFYSSLIILTGMLIIMISRILMFRFRKYKKISYLVYIAWVLAEIISMATFYALFVDIILEDLREFEVIYKASIKNTSLVLLLPYSILWLYFSWREKDQQLEELSENDKETTITNKMIPFHDEKGILRFSIKADDVLYLEASDNYVTIYYSNNNKVSKFLIRNTLKLYESKLKPYHIIRCHRSYMVNIEKVKIIRKEKDGLHLELDITSPSILPVSKTYLQPVMDAFSKFYPAY